MGKKIFLILMCLKKNYFYYPLSKHYIQKKYLGLLHFIHEFHHFLEINEMTELPQNLLDKPLYCIAKNGYNYTEKSGIYNIQMQANEDTTNLNQKKINKIKLFLSGYAAENTYKKHFYLLSLFNNSINNIYKDDFLLLLYYHYAYQNLIDIKNALLVVKNIDYNTPEIQYYIKKYKYRVIHNKYYKSLKKYNKNENEIIFLYGIYHELNKKYSQKKYYTKLYNIINNNPEVFTIEILFLSDLQSLWNKEKLSRDLANLSNYNIDEVEIIKNIQSIDKMQKNIDLLDIFKNKIDYPSIFFDYTQNIKEKIKKTVSLLQKKHKSFYRTFKEKFL